jgi:hypothetical protein
VGIDFREKRVVSRAALLVCSPWHSFQIHHSCPVILAPHQLPMIMWLYKSKCWMLDGIVGDQLTIKNRTFVENIFQSQRACLWSQLLRWHFFYNCLVSPDVFGDWL